MCPRDAKCCSASNMVICPLGTEKKYIIHVSTDPQIALNTGMCKISIVNIKKKTASHSSAQKYRGSVHLKKIIYLFLLCTRGENEHTKKKKKKRKENRET